MKEDGARAAFELALPRARLGQIGLDAARSGGEPFDDGEVLGQLVDDDEVGEAGCP